MTIDEHDDQALAQTPRYKGPYSGAWQSDPQADPACEGGALPTAKTARHLEPLLTIADVAAQLGICKRSVSRRVKNGQLRKAPIGGRAVRFTVEELERCTGLSRERSGSES